MTKDNGNFKLKSIVISMYGVHKHIVEYLVNQGKFCHTMTWQSQLAYVSCFHV